MTKPSYGWQYHNIAPLTI